MIVGQKQAWWCEWRCVSGTSTPTKIVLAADLEIIDKQLQKERKKGRERQREIFGGVGKFKKSSARIGSNKRQRRGGL